jgi:hypothetical protein
MATLNHKPTCDPNPADTVADFSMHVTDLRLDGNPIWNRLQELGIKTIVRYYDWDPESQPCKTLFRDETNAILANKFSIAVVFQHFNGDPETFIDTTRGKKDAERSLDLAEHNGQPPGSKSHATIVMDCPQAQPRSGMQRARISKMTRGPHNRVAGGL